MTQLSLRLNPVERVSRDDRQPSNLQLDCAVSSMVVFALSGAILTMLGTLIRTL